MKKTVFVILLTLIIFLGLWFKPTKVKVNIIFPEELKGINFVIKIDKKDKSWLIPGKHKLEIIFGKNKLVRELYVPRFFFSLKEYDIYIEKPEINVDYDRVDYDQIILHLNSKNYKMDYWKIKYKNYEYKTSLKEYKIFISPFERYILKAEGYIGNKKIYEKSFEITAPLSKIKDYKIEIRDYIEIILNLENNMITPVKYEIYKNGKFVETIDNNIYKDTISYDEITYEIIPVYPTGYKGDKIKIVKPKMTEIPNKINKALNLKYKKVFLNGKEYLPEDFKEGENELKIFLNDYTVWYKKIYFDSTPQS
ncbi:hypothetical protein [Marinitoga lauensis]|uniref:hypothetical protein n=1 Tax=Marinitoga lauensis TaxID=2201189 RepID=UPI0010122339|nr:hypothetical protein [Marinitoga lauensis]